MSVIQVEEKKVEVGKVLCVGRNYVEHIHELLIKSAAELISEHTPNYQFVAARLISYKLRKEAYGDYDVPPLTAINPIPTT